MDVGKVESLQMKKKRQGKRRMKRKLDKEEKNLMKEKLIRFK